MGAPRSGAPSHDDTGRGAAERETDGYDGRPALLARLLLGLHPLLPGVGGREVLGAAVG